MDVRQQRVYQVFIQDVDEFRQRFVETQAKCQHSMVDDAVDQ